MTEIHRIKFKLYNTLEGMDRIDAYSDLVFYIQDSDHLLKKHRKTGTEVKKVMGGHILELESERLMRVGREEQRKEDEKIIAEKDATITQTNTELAQTRERIKELEAQDAALKKA